MKISKPKPSHLFRPTHFFPTAQINFLSVSLAPHQNMAMRLSRSLHNEVGKHSIWRTWLDVHATTLLKNIYICLQPSFISSSTLCLWSSEARLEKMHSFFFIWSSNAQSPSFLIYVLHCFFFFSFFNFHLNFIYKYFMRF